MIKAETSDQSAIMDFLMAHQTIAMFPITNLRDYGMAGGNAKAMTFWMQVSEGVLTDVLGITDAGIVLPVFTTHEPRDIGAALLGRQITGIIGQADPVAEVKAALGLPDGALNRIEPHFELSLDALKMPETTGVTLLPVAAVSRETMIVWRTQYGIDALDLTPQGAALQASEAVERMAALDSHRVLMAGGEALAMTGFNAILPETVMIGGVYTPSALRGRGYAKTALAMHLAEAHTKGIRRAVLSAANASAAKAYTAIGFQQVGEFMIVLYDQPQVHHV